MISDICICKSYEYITLLCAYTHMHVYIDAGVHIYTLIPVLEPQTGLSAMSEAFVSHENYLEG